MKCNEPVILFVFCSFLLFAGCRQAYVEKRHIRTAEELIGQSPERARDELDRIATTDYLKLPVKWKALYTLLQCRIADRLETDLPMSHEIETAKEWYTRKGNITDAVALHLFLGRACMDDKDYRRASSVFLEGLKPAQKGNLVNEAGYLNSYLADVYLKNNDAHAALEKYREAADCFLKAGNTRSYGFAKRDMGFAYDILELYPEALAAMHKADSVGRMLNDSLMLTSVLNGFGNIYTSMGEYDRAISCLTEALRKDPESRPDQMALIEVYIEADRLTEARQLLDSMFRDSIPETFRRNIHYYYYMIYSKEGDSEKALSHLGNYHHLLDKHELEREEYNYIEAEKKYNHLDMTAQFQELTIKQQRNIILTGILSLILFILLSLYLYLGRQASRRIARQEHLINKSRQEIIRLTQELKIKRKEPEKTDNAGTERKEYEIGILKEALQQAREALIRLSPVYKKMLNRTKSVKAQDKTFIDDNLWVEIESEIDSIYPDYRNQLRKLYPVLTSPDIQYCCFSLYGFSTNEEAILLGIVPDSVSKKRTRIREKLQVVLSNTNLSAYLKKQYREAL
jgi:tetratricopeptide (TPR) repeat protein